MKGYYLDMAIRRLTQAEVELIGAQKYIAEASYEDGEDYEFIARIYKTIKSLRSTIDLAVQYSADKTLVDR